MVLNVSQRILKGTLWLQWVAGLSVMMMLFVIGLSIGWSSPYLAKFTSGNSSFPATIDEISWMASVYNLGRLPGAIVGAVCVQYFSSKTAMFGNGCALLISYILVIVANSVNWLYVSRFICGMSIEVANVSFPLFLGDVASSRIRGALVTLALNGEVIGVFVGNIMGHYLSMEIFACVTFVPIIGFLLLVVWIPQSPYYLMSKGLIEGTKKSILRYNPNANVQLEVESIKEFLAVSNSITFCDRLREFNIPKNRKAAITIILSAMFMHFSGMNAMTAYTESIMNRSMITVIAPSTVIMIANIVGILSGCMVMYLIEKCGRRMTWVISSFGVSVSLIFLGLHFYLLGDGFDATRLQWLPISSIFSFKIFLNLGLYSVPTILFSELFGSNIRAIAGCVIAVFSATCGFLSLYGYQFLLEIIDECYVWWIHAIIVALGLIFGLILIPEMKGKTLLEIQSVLMTN